jgi:pimeloyl-ACP methyl ester carboxylesterase
MYRRLAQAPVTMVTERPEQVERHRWKADRSALAGCALAVLAVQLAALAAISDVSPVGRLTGVMLAVGGTMGLAAASRSTRWWVRGGAELIGGSVALTVGLALAPTWYATTGLSYVVVLGLLSLVAGAALLVVGGATLLRPLPRWWRLLAIPVTFVMVQFMLLPLTMAVYATHPPVTPTTAMPPREATEVSFVTHDGARLAGWYTAPLNDAVVILLPGSGGEKGSLVDHARVLATHGYGTLSLDSRGTGTSGGVGNAWGWHGSADVAAALDWLAHDMGVPEERVALLGLSMGGEVALTVAAEHPRLAGVVAEGVSARVAGDLGYLGSSITERIEHLDGALMWAIGAMLTDASPPPPLRAVVERASAAQLPMLLIVGDDPAESGAATILAAAAPGMEVWRLPETPHIQSLARHPAEWESRVVPFLDRALGPSS